ncbi:MAG: PilZ domain-containing protein [Novosphingobium sp.]|nr:PilZ domain-containing protein [Novosphingobium sp.]
MDRRKEDRLAVDLLGVLNRTGKAPVCVDVSQVSANGCRLTGRNLDLHPGEQIELAFGGLVGMQAEVQWAHGDMAGVRLAASLHPAIMRYFASFIRLAG